MGSAVRCRLLKPSGRLLKLGGSATAGFSSSAALQVPSPRDRPYSFSLNSSPPPETRARAEREQTRDARAPLCLLCNRDYLSRCYTVTTRFVHIILLMPLSARGCIGDFILRDVEVYIYVCTYLSIKSHFGQNIFEQLQTK